MFFLLLWKESPKFSDILRTEEFRILAVFGRLRVQIKAEDLRDGVVEMFL